MLAEKMSACRGKTGGRAERSAGGGGGKEKVGERARDPRMGAGCVWGELRRDGRGEKRRRKGERAQKPRRWGNNAAGVCGLWWGKQAGRGSRRRERGGRRKKAAAKAARQPWGNGAGDERRGGIRKTDAAEDSGSGGRRNGRCGPGKTEAKGYRRRKDDHSRAGSVGSMEPDEPEQRRRPACLARCGEGQPRRQGRPGRKKRCGNGWWRGGEG